jgi:hypothetical protein
VGSIFFTLGGGLQTSLAFAERHDRGTGSAAWRSAVAQSAGTVFFNVSTFRALDTALSNPEYDRLVWRPDAFGSVCFLVSGAIAYRAARRHGWLPARGSPGWWQPAVNLLGCVFFGISAIAGYLVPSSGSVLDLAAANWSTCLGAACFLGARSARCIRAAPRSGRSRRHPERGMPRRSGCPMLGASSVLGSHAHDNCRIAQRQRLRHGLPAGRRPGRPAA